MNLMTIALPLSVTWELDGLRFNAQDVYGCEWVVDTESGWAGSAPTRTNRSEKVNAHGSYRAPVYRDTRTIALTGYCAAPSAVERRRAEGRIAGICADPNTLYPLVCHEERGPVVSEVELDEAVEITTLHERWFEWSIQLAAPDPRKHSLNWQTMSTGLAMDAGDGLDFQATSMMDPERGLQFGMWGEGEDDGLLFGTSNASGFMTLTNRGTAPSFPIYTLHGPLTNPTLTTPLGVARYNDVLEPGQILVIDPAVPSVLLGGTATRRRLLEPAQFDGLAIPPTRGAQPGTLSVGLTHTGPVTDTGWVEAEFRSAWF